MNNTPVFPEREVTPQEKSKFLELRCVVAPRFMRSLWHRSTGEELFPVSLAILSQDSSGNAQDKAEGNKTLPWKFINVSKTIKGRLKQKQVIPKGCMRTDKRGENKNLRLNC